MERVEKQNGVEFNFVINKSYGAPGKAKPIKLAILLYLQKFYYIAIGNKIGSFRIFKPEIIVFTTISISPGESSSSRQKTW